MKALHTLFLVAVICISCHKEKNSSFTKKSVQGTWLIQAIDMDTDYYKPNTLVMEFSEDSLYYKSIKDDILGKQKLRFSKDSITLDTVRYSRRNFKVDGDKIQFVRNVGYRVQASYLLDPKIIKTLLVTKSWKNDKGIFRFKESDKKVDFIPSNQKEYYSYCYDVITYGNHVFLQKKGNQLSCERDYQFIEQIISVSDNEITTFGFLEGEFKKIRYKSVDQPLFGSAVEFQLCNPYINKNYPRDRYYYQGTEYNGGLYHIRKIINNLYKEPKGSTESGIFQVRFVVNCEGKAGMYESQAFDTDYQLKEFSPMISNQILEITKGLQDWIPGRTQKNNQAIDTYIYLSFRIKNGKIIRIYP